MVKALKGEPLNGYFDYEIAGKVRRFDQSNVQAFVERIPRALARMIARHLDVRATLVPIPNANVTIATRDFRTFELARAVAGYSGGQLQAVPALAFDQPQVRSHEGGPRSPYHFEQAYRILHHVTGPIVLLDDVCTSGGHMIAAHWLLHEPPRRTVALACSFGRTTREQVTHPVGVRQEELNVAK
jgi:predicted amidophosphoribosyltransferase